MSTVYDEDPRTGMRDQQQVMMQRYLLLHMDIVVAGGKGSCSERVGGIQVLGPGRQETGSEAGEPGKSTSQAGRMGTKCRTGHCKYGRK